MTAYLFWAHNFLNVKPIQKENDKKVHQTGVSPLRKPLTKIKQNHMPRKLLILSLLIITYIGTSHGQKFFEVETIDQAQAKIFYVEDEKVCDLKVWFVYEEAQITGPGLWMEVPEENQADIKIIFVDDIEQSDMTICMGLNETEAGWLNEGKKALLE